MGVLGDIIAPAALKAEYRPPILIASVSASHGGEYQTTIKSELLKQFFKVSSAALRIAVA